MEQNPKQPVSLFGIEYEDEILFISTFIEGASVMSEKTTNNGISEEVGFNAAPGWLAALSVSVAAWASFAS